MTTRIYLPAVYCAEGGPTRIRQLSPLGNEPNQYGFALVTYAYWGKYKLPQRGVWYFGDSGGFTMMNSGENFDPLDVIRWQISECAVGVILDVPPYADDRSGQTAGWKKGLSLTVSHTARALPLYLEAREQGVTDFRWWGVIHGRGWAEMEEWYREISAVYPFTDDGEGWAFKAGNTNDPVSLARSLHFLQKKGVRHAHSLMTSGIPGTAALSVISRWAGLDVITHDAGTPYLLGTRREIIIPTKDGLDWEYLPERDGDDKPVRRYLRDTCDCGICVVERPLIGNDLDADKDSVWKRRFWHHNILVMDRVYRNLDREIAIDPEGFLRKLLGAKLYSQTLRAFEGREPVTVAQGTPRSLFDFT
jgi:hypothetical protein